MTHVNAPSPLTATISPHKQACRHVYMVDPIRVLVLGTGQMGAGIARLVLEKQGLDLVGAFGRRAERAGMDLGQVLALDAELGMQISNDLEIIISQTRPAAPMITTRVGFFLFDIGIY